MQVWHPIGYRSSRRARWRPGRAGVRGRLPGWSTSRSPASPSAWRRGWRTQGPSGRTGVAPQTGVRRSGPRSLRISQRVRSARAPSEQHHGKGHGHDLEIRPKAPLVDVLEIITKFAANVVQGGIVLQVDLGMAGDPRPDPLALLVVGNLLAQVCHDGRAFGA